jgi:hypothetical protein
MAQIRSRLDTIRKDWNKKNDQRRDDLRRRLDKFRKGGKAPAPKDEEAPSGEETPEEQTP